VIVGLLLSVVGSYFLAVFGVRQQRNLQKDIVKNFCADTVTNIRQIVDDMAELRTKAKVIHADYLALMDVEISVFGRNREHIIHLPADLREKTRKFVTDCALRRAEIGNFLAAFQAKWTLADQMQSHAQSPVEAQRIRDDSNVPLNAAHKALDELVDRVRDSTTLVADIRKIR
jgi:undecaprenyl pyrophosphate synthase